MPSAVRIAAVLVAILFSWSGAAASGAGPAHDDFEDRQNVSVLFEYTDAVATYGATLEPGEQTPCDMGSSVWYAVAPEDGGVGMFHVLTQGSDFDTVLAVYVENDAGELELVECNDDFIGLQSFLAYRHLGAKPFYIQVGGFAGDQGNLRLTVARVLPL